jgi:hypothetical protein
VLVQVAVPHQVATSASDIAVLSCATVKLQRLVVFHTEVTCQERLALVVTVAALPDTLHVIVFVTVTSLAQSLASLLVVSHIV